ncbi:hypothetical protein DEAC_c17430 [Desulfosporosinus acididurans]|uniref:Uncharacterized protein n=1 Tax=Desulfosporosinus acididurans TaxID=476652 RepID=A0A0J1FS93_9FIRM|nr:hypothetical protein [Desulfosporosinus acididurans]KLU66344.1 hypothetical protein DEAC_c17430 [Desulfosporosinus acididurans]
MSPEGAIPDMTLKIGKTTVYVFAPEDQSPERIAKVKAEFERACQPILLEMAERSNLSEKVS